MAIILGIDPGSVVTGYGIISAVDGHHTHIAEGVVKTGGGSLPDRLKAIFIGLSECIDTHSPDEMAIEQVFMSRNADSALKLGQAKGAAICAAVAKGLPVHEYAAREIKQATVGKGSAEKQQVQHMVKILLCLQRDLQADAADALAVALCHAHTQASQRKLGSLGGQWR